TIFGVIIVPGLYLIFATISGGRKLIKEEDENPLTENIIESNSDESFEQRVTEIVTKTLNDNDNKSN
ncbi:MAG: hypothetical protein L6Q66_13150, partial [Bacteroidia bacterium]|nr:hypothetical protein [Bacteroidia bacterium]